MHSAEAPVLTRLVAVPLWPQMAPRAYVECPRCRLPNALVTYVRVRTQCCFCPHCRHLWDTARVEPSARPLADEAPRANVMADDRAQ